MQDDDPLFANKNDDFPNVGRYTYGHQSALQYACSPVTIGNFCCIGPGVILAPSEHDIYSISQHHFHQDRRYGYFLQDQEIKSERWSEKYRNKKSGLIIENDVWIGANAIILSGIHIGNGATIAAGGVVTKDVPDFAVVGGCPTKIIKYRFTPEEQSYILKSQWWDWSDDELKEHIELFHNPDAFFDFIKDKYSIKNNKAQTLINAIRNFNRRKEKHVQKL